MYRYTKYCLAVPSSSLHLQPLLLVSCESFQTVPFFHEQMWKYIPFSHFYINTCLSCSVLWIFAEYGLAIFSILKYKSIYFWSSLIIFLGIDGHCLPVGTQVVDGHLLLQTALQWITLVHKPFCIEELFDRDPHLWNFTRLYTFITLMDVSKLMLDSYQQCPRDPILYMIFHEIY